MESYGNYGRPGSDRKYTKSLRNALFGAALGLFSTFAGSAYAQRATDTETFDSSTSTKSYTEEHPEKWDFRNAKLEADDWSDGSGRSTWLFNNALINFETKSACLEVELDKSDWDYSASSVGIVIGGDPIGNNYYEFSLTAKLNEPAQFGMRRQSPGLNHTYFQVCEGNDIEGCNFPVGTINKGGMNKLKVCYDSQGYDFYLNDILVLEDVKDIPVLESFVGVMHFDSSNSSDPQFSSVIKVDNFKIQVDTLAGGGALEDPSKPYIPDIFLRGDSNMDGVVDISDVIHQMNYLFLDSQQLECPDAGDVNDDGRVDISDPIALLFNRFGDVKIPAPNIGGKGMDLTYDSLPKCNGYGDNPWQPN